MSSELKAAVPGAPGWAAEKAGGGFTTDTGWLDFHASPVKPSYVPPPGAVDAHCHVFGPGAEFPYAPERKYTPCDAGKAKLCDDGNPCTADKCDGANGAKNCSHAAIGEGSTCDDSDLCTINDVCTSGACVGKGGSCTTSYSDAFDCASTSSWSLSAAAGSFKSAWAIDGTPNPPQPKSGACSLNFNNGTNFDDNVAVDGTATSPSIALPATGKVRLSFWSWHDTELSSNYDTRTVAVSVDQFSSTPVQKQLENGDPGQQWLFQTIDLTALAGKSVQIRFSFDSIDAANNAGAGWFIDDVKIDVLP